ncbi:hypothetical protein V5H98_09995 [Georgenia sp. M64]|uniref:hypothetical protein n=1 Tax=Georgenia sp. M64 TaxID=3120520 RepID=UPI0030E4FB13
MSAVTTGTTAPVTRAVEALVPRDMLDLRLHLSEDEARAEIAERVGRDAPGADVDAVTGALLVLRRGLLRRPVIWAGLVSAVYPADADGAGAAGTSDATDGAGTPGIDSGAGGAQTSDVADGAGGAGTSDVLDGVRGVFVQLSVQVHDLPPLPDDAPVAQHVMLARALRARHPGAHVETVTTPVTAGAAVVRLDALDWAAQEHAGMTVPPGTEPLEHGSAEIHLPFPAAGALVVVTASTFHRGSLESCARLATMVAQSVHVLQGEEAR